MSQERTVTRVRASVTGGEETAHIPDRLRFTLHLPPLLLLPFTSPSSPSSPQAPDLNSRRFSRATARCIIRKAQTHTQPRYEQTRTHRNPLDGLGHISCLKSEGAIARHTACIMRKRARGSVPKGGVFKAVYLPFLGLFNLCKELNRMLLPALGGGPAIYKPLASAISLVDGQLFLKPCHR